MSGKIIIIEDDTILLKTLSLQLQQGEYEVLSAKDGASGIELIKQEKPDLILLDLMMPKIDGYELLSLVRKNNDVKDTKCIMLTNLGQEENKEKAEKLGIEYYFVKATTNLDILMKKIEEVLGR